MRNIRFIKKSIKQFVFPKTNAQVISDIDTANLLYIRIIAFVFMIIELARLCYLPLCSNTAKDTNTIIRTVLIIVASAIVTIIATILKKRGGYTHLQVKTLVIAAYICWITWAFFTSYSHYEAGEQIITFYTALFVFVCFINLRFITSFIMITSTFVGCFIMLYHTDKAEDINMFNFCVMYVVLLFAAMVKYHFTVSQNKRRIRMMEMNETLKNVSRYDHLTKSRNRNALNDDLHKYVGRHIYIVVCDIDYLKYYNDKYGHVAGDKIIAEVAKIEKEVFKDAHVYRYGGDEFIILGDAKTPECVTTLLNTVKEKISNTHIEGVEESIFCSFGHMIADINSTDDIEHYIAEADRILYNNKKTNHAIEKSILFKH